MPPEGDIVDVDELIKSYYPDTDPSSVDPAFVVAVHLISTELEPGDGIAYNGHHIVKADSSLLVVDIYSGRRLVDRVFPHFLGSARVFAEYIDRAMAGTTDTLPAWREAAGQRSELN